MKKYRYRKQHFYGCGGHMAWHSDGVDKDDETVQYNVGEYVCPGLEILIKYSDV